MKAKRQLYKQRSKNRANALQDEKDEKSNDKQNSQDDDRLWKQAMASKNNNMAALAKQESKEKVTKVTGVIASRIIEE